MTTQFPFRLVFMYPKGRNLLLHLQRNLSFQMHSQLIKYSNQFGHHQTCHFKTFLSWFDLFGFLLLTFASNIRDPNTVRVL